MEHRALLLIILLICAISSVGCKKAANDETQVIRGRVAKPQQLKQDNLQEMADYRTLQVTLNHGKYSTYVNQNGEFTFYNIPDGKYVLDVVSRFFAFQRVFITKNSAHSYHQVQLMYQLQDPISLQKDEQFDATAQELVINSAQKVIYFEKLEQFSILSIFSTPYGLMIMFMLATYYCAKKLPMEEMQQAASQQQEQAQIQPGQSQQSKK